MVAVLIKVKKTRKENASTQISPEETRKTTTQHTETYVESLVESIYVYPTTVLGETRVQNNASFTIQRNEAHATTVATEHNVVYEPTTSSTTANIDGSLEEHDYDNIYDN